MINNKALALINLLSSIDASTIVLFSKIISQSFSSGNKILIAGNGGSASDAQHFAAELVGRYKRTRPPLPAISLTTDTSIITAISNDFSYDEVFSRQVSALGRPNDILFTISTSGRSRNCINAMHMATSLHMVNLSLLGNPDSPMANHATHFIHVNSPNTDTIQEMHLFIIHCICELIEKGH